MDKCVQLGPLNNLVGLQCLASQRITLNPLNPSLFKEDCFPNGERMEKANGSGLRTGLFGVSPPPQLRAPLLLALRARALPEVPKPRWFE